MDNDTTSDLEKPLSVHKHRKGLYILPNLFTLAALFGGFYAIVMAMNGRMEQAAIGVFCAMVLDSLDGRVARMTHTQTAFGAQMDSLSDMVSFGAARRWWLMPGGSKASGAGAGLLPSCTAPAPRCVWHVLTSTQRWSTRATFKACPHQLLRLCSWALSGS